MSFDTLLKEVESLGASEQRKLLAYIVTLEDRRQADYAAKLASRVDDTAPGRWLTPEQCERELGLTDEAP
jgi:hypothetical protein